MKHKPDNILLLLITGLTFCAPAHAYVDPGTGSILLQGLIAGIAAATAAGSLFWYRIKNFFRSLFGKDKTDEQD